MISFWVSCLLLSTKVSFPFLCIWTNNLTTFIMRALALALFELILSLGNSVVRVLRPLRAHVY